VDRVRWAAEAEAKKCGLPDGPIAAFFQQPKSRTDWLLQLAMQGDKRNPLLVNFITEKMPEPAIQTRAPKHEGANPLKATKGKGARGKQAA
jgi:hypothetical protein